MHHSIKSCEEEERHQLLISLKQTVERLLASCSNNVWNTYGGLSRLCTVIENILCHRLHCDDANKTNGYLNFVSGLQWPKSPLISVTSESVYSGNEKLAKEQQWLKASLQQHTLSSQLEVLTQDKNHLSSCYQKEAFLCNKEYRKALLICLRAVEENQVALLAKLDPKLLVKKNPELNHSETEHQNKRNKRSYSLNSSNSNYQMVSSNNGGRKKKIYHSKTTKIGICELPDFSTSSTEVQSSNENQTFDVSKLYTQSSKTEDCNQYILCKQLPIDAGKMKLLNTECSNQFNKDEYTNHSQSSCKLFKQFNSNCQCKLLCEYCVNSASCPNLNTCDSNFQKLKTVRRNCKSLLVLNESNISDQNSESAKVILCMNCNRKIKPNLQRTWQTTAVCCSKNEVKCKYNCTKCDSSTVTTKTASKPQHTRSKSDTTYNPYLMKDTDELTETESTVSSLSSSLPCQLGKKNRRISLLEDGSRIGVPTECFFPQPHEGQSLISFLSSNDFDSCAELDKENAHFCISEALISAIEQIKCNQSLKQAEEDDDDSDEEIQKLKQYIRIRRRRRQLEKLRVKNFALLSDGKTDTTTTSASPMSSPYSSTASFGSSDSSGTEDDVDELELTDATESRLSSIQEKGLSLSMASLYSDADIQRINSVVSQNSNFEQTAKIVSSPDFTSGQLSAESVALCLLKKFSKEQLPKASELQWLVSERDAPQTLLPLPDSWPVSPDIVEEEYSSQKTRLRGNLEWAPPRAQIIFNIHPEPIRKVLIAKQNYRCAGCGTKINQGLVNRFRYCEYLGKYFCQCCHSNATAFIPGRILYKWDFSKYHVSKFSYSLLDRMFTDPLFNIADINSLLYQKIRQLGLVREYRTQMFYLKDFIRTCRGSGSLQDEISAYPTHLFSDPQVYSLQDLVQVKNGELSQQLHLLVVKCIRHISQCILCKAKGFICEICNKGNDVIFPFELMTVTQCPVCWACYHRNCYVRGVCPKCIRIEARHVKDANILKETVKGIRTSLKVDIKYLNNRR